MFRTNLLYFPLSKNQQAFVKICADSWITNHVLTGVYTISMDYIRGDS